MSKPAVVIVRRDGTCVAGEWIPFDQKTGKADR